MKATYNGTVIAESDKTIEVENNQYFPEADVKMEYLKDSDLHTTCPWKGEASYRDVVVDGETVKDAAWYYPSPSEAAENIKGHMAFWNGVEVSE